MKRTFHGRPAAARRHGPSARGNKRGAAQRRRAPLGLFLGGLLLLAAGCSGGGTTAPQISPREGADRALAEYDANKDGALDAEELDACPGLKSALKRIDKDGDGRLTAEEIAERLTLLQPQEPMEGVSVEATFNGNPLGGATVTLVPEKFQGPSFKPVTTVTDEVGTGTLPPPGSDEYTVPPGYYRVEVSKKNVKGQEMIPAKYNTKTVLGQEIARDVDVGRGAGVTIRLPLTSK